MWEICGWVILRFWLAHLENAVAQAERGRGQQSLARIVRSWPSWRGRAVEPVVREALARLLPDDTFPGVSEVGGWWNRQNNPEVGVVGADAEPVAGAVHFVGSVKWRDDAPFDVRDLRELAEHAKHVPGAEGAGLVAVTRAPVAAEARAELTACCEPQDLLGAWSCWQRWPHFGLHMECGPEGRWEQDVASSGAAAGATGPRW